VESAFDVLVKARALEAQGRSVIHLEIGEPDFPTPAHIVEARKTRWTGAVTHYGPARAIPSCGRTVAAHVSETRGIDVGAQHVCIVPGGKRYVFPDDGAARARRRSDLPNPGFPIYESMIRFSGCDRRSPCRSKRVAGFHWMWNSSRAAEQAAPSW
jgi:aspartate/methionine/tyrosine aminotransferase